MTTSYKYFKIVKIAAYIFKHTKTFRVFGKHKVKKINVEYLRYNNFPFFGNQNLINVKCQKQPPTVLKYFPKILW